MFALEISFQDGASPAEVLFIRRPQSLIGSSDDAHVVIEDMAEMNLQLRLARDVGRKFRCKPVSSPEDQHSLQLFEGTYEGEADIDLGKVKLHITALDSDLLLKENEPPDRAGVRILRQACSAPSPLFPAVLVRGSPPLVVSFVPDQPIFIGRAKPCGLRLDASDISAKHARVGFESGEFWIEDLGSTNGTFIDQQQISGRMSVSAGQPIVLGKEITIVGVASVEQLERASKASAEPARKSNLPDRRYPVLLSVSEVARPARFAVPIGATITVGRDPNCDIWLGAPHVSRKHCLIAHNLSGTMAVTDVSTNGTAYDGGILAKGDVLEVANQPKVLDFGGGVTLAVCHNEQQERQFTASMGSPWTFTPSPVPVLIKDSVAGSAHRPTRVALRPGARRLDALELYQTFLSLRFYMKAIVVLVLFSVFVLFGVICSLVVGMLM